VKRVLSPSILLCSLICVGCASSELPQAARNVHVVESGILIRGAQPNREGFRLLQSTYGVSTVINLNDWTARREAPIVTSLGMKYLAIPSDPSRPEQEKVLAFLRAVQREQRHGPVYVHCQEGMDRTGVAVAAYRILINGWDDDRALADLRSFQQFPHAQLFPRIAPFVHEIYRRRQLWIDRLLLTDGATSLRLAFRRIGSTCWRTREDCREGNQVEPHDWGA
jgi:protein tyrosine phosphatase (PTP) superfamily phosphohydrolase (DUF442 family)